MISVLVVGGDYKDSFVHKGKEMNMDITHHSAWGKHKNGKRTFESLVRNSDCIILFPDACSHQTMWDVKELSKYYGKKIVYQKGKGVTQALNKVFQLMKDWSPQVA